MDESITPASDRDFGHVGRLAFSGPSWVDIQPIHYVYGEGVLYGRTSAGTKLTSLERNRWVAFEVDEVTGLFDWQSVVVHGSVYLVEDDGPPIERKAHAQTLERLRSLVPDALREGDPAPLRTVLFRLHLVSMTGRAAWQETKPATRTPEAD